LAKNLFSALAAFAMIDDRMGVGQQPGWLCLQEFICPIQSQNTAGWAAKAAENQEWISTAAHR
jgi:hypothetical protein